MPDIETMTMARIVGATLYEDGEIIGWSEEREPDEGEPYLMVWDATALLPVCSWVTLAEFGGTERLALCERKRLGV